MASFDEHCRSVLSKWPHPVSFREELNIPSQPSTSQQKIVTSKENLSPLPQLTQAENYGVKRTANEQATLVNEQLTINFLFVKYVPYF